MMMGGSKASLGLGRVDRKNVVEAELWIAMRRQNFSNGGNAGIAEWSRRRHDGESAPNLGPVESLDADIYDFAYSGVLPQQGRP